MTYSGCRKRYVILQRRRERLCNEPVEAREARSQREYDLLRLQTRQRLGCNRTERATGRDNLLRLQTRRKLGCNMTMRATGKDDLLRRQTRRRLDFNVTDATGSSKHWEHLASRSSHFNIQQHSVQAKMTKFHVHLVITDHLPYS